MSTSAILPISTIDFGSSSATAPEQTLFNNVLSRLEQSISGGDLTTAKSLLNAINSLSPSSASASTPLGTFLTGVNKALQDQSATEAQSALATYQSATPAATAPSASGASATAASITAQLIRSQNQQLLAATFASLSSNTQSTASGSSTSPTDSLYSLLATVYGQNDSSSATPSDAATPYNTALATLQASLTAGNGTLTPAFAYLQASGNFVNTSA